MRCEDCPLRLDNISTDRRYVTIPLPLDVLSFIEGDMPDVLVNGYPIDPASYIYNVLIDYLNQRIDIRGINPRKQKNLYFTKLYVSYDNNRRKAQSLSLFE